MKNTAKARAILKMAGLVEVTSNRQEKNGTIAFRDPVVSNKRKTIVYAITKSGYAHRYVYRKNAISPSSNYLTKPTDSNNFMSYPGRYDFLAKTTVARAKAYREQVA